MDEKNSEKIEEVSLDNLDLDTVSFDRAQVGQHCVYCKTPLAEQYFEIDGLLACDDCRQILAGQASGSAAGRFGGAVFLGLMTAALGSAVYYLFTKITGWEFGLLAIGLGFVVGLAVKRGCGGRGGLLYQLLAVFLTYGAIGFSYLPFAYSGPLGGGQATAAMDIVALAVLAFYLPVAVAMKSLISVVIIGIALWQAFKIPAYKKIDVKGPFELHGGHGSESLSSRQSSVNRSSE